MPPEESAVRRLCIVDRSRAEEPTTKPFVEFEMVVLPTAELSNTLARFRTLTFFPQPFPWARVRHVCLADKTTQHLQRGVVTLPNNDTVIGPVPTMI
jgi:hypothetical protein